MIAGTGKPTRASGSKGGGGDDDLGHVLARVKNAAKKTLSAGAGSTSTGTVNVVQCSQMLISSCARRDKEEKAAAAQKVKEEKGRGAKGELAAYSLDDFLAF